MSTRNYRNILIRAVNRLGDTIFTLPAIKALDRAFPDAEITVLTKPVTSDLYKNNPSIDEILIFKDRGIHKGIRGRIRLASELRKRYFDLAIIFHNCFDAALVPFLAGIPERIGYVREGRGFLLTKHLPFPDKIIHRIDLYLALLSLLGLTTDDKVPELFVTADEKRWAVEYLKEQRINRPLIGIVPGSLALTRRWFPERFTEVSDLLSKTTGGSTIIFGGPDDREISDLIKKQMKTSTIDVTGLITIRQLIALMYYCDLIISNNTGPMLIAWALGRPVVVPSFGAGDIREAQPLSPLSHIIEKGSTCIPCNEEERCPKGTLKCLDSASVKEVYDMAMEMLRKTWVIKS